MLIEVYFSFMLHKLLSVFLSRFDLTQTAHTVINPIYQEKHNSDLDKYTIDNNSTLYCLVEVRCMYYVLCQNDSQVCLSRKSGTAMIGFRSFYLCWHKFSVTSTASSDKVTGWDEVHETSLTSYLSSALNERQQIDL